MESWRLILDGEGPAAHNMAVDEAMLAAHADGEAPPTLRIYYWATPAISLGYFQRVERSRIDLDYCEAAGITLVRRPTGGRAVLHGHDVTFSVVMAESRIPKAFRGVLGSHLWIISGIVRAFELLGINARIGCSGAGGGPVGADCFAHISECDVRWERGKCAGAAQVRKCGAILEQGSIPHLDPRIDYARVFRGAASPESPLRSFSRKSVEDAVVRGFGSALGIDLEAMELTDTEKRLARDLAENKYESAEWTSDRRALSVDNSMLSCYTDSASLRGGRRRA